jgi:hypothetical protein
MKKCLTAIALMLLATGAFTQDMSLSAGAQVNYMFILNGFGTDPDDVDLTYHIVSAGAFVDITYVMVSVNYAFNLGPPIGTAYVDGDKNDANTDALNDQLDKIAVSYLVITALGKYPFNVGGMVISPMIGLEYQLNLTLTDDGEDQKDDLDDDEVAALNDLYILAGACADFNIGENLYLRVMALFAYNLTPDSAAGLSMMGDPDDEWGWSIKGGVAIGYMF